MNTQDITEEQFETLVLIRTLEEFVTDEHENLSTLSGAVWTLEESLSDEEKGQLVADICKLTEKGYLLSDGTAEHMEIGKIPEVESITLKGQSVLNEWAAEIKGNIDKEAKEAKGKSDIHIHISIFGELSINASFLGISNTVFSSLGSVVRGMLHI